MMDASGAEPSLGNLEAAAFAEQDVRCRHAHVFEQDLAVPMRCIAVAEDGQRSLDRDARRIGGHEDHRLLTMDIFTIRIGFAHKNEQPAARTTGAG